MVVVSLDLPAVEVHQKPRNPYRAGPEESDRLVVVFDIHEEMDTSNSTPTTPRTNTSLGSIS